MDLEVIVLKWAHEMFDTLRTKDQKKLKIKNLEFSIDWKKVRFIHSEPDYSHITDHTDATPKQKAQVITL